MSYPHLWNACVTPFNYKGDSIDYFSLERLLKIQNKVGNGILLLGSTGEVLSLTNLEKRALIEFICKMNLRVKILVNIPGVNLQESLDLINFCNDMPIYSYLITTPIYTKPGIIGQTLWFEKLFKKSHIPVMIYNNPSRTGVKLYIKTVCNLHKHEKFWAIKDSSGNINTLIKYKKVAPNIKIFCGDDNMMFRMASYGITNLISVASNIWPLVTYKYTKICISMSLKKQTIKHKKIIPQISKNDMKILSLWDEACKNLLIATNPIPVKMLLYKNKIIKYKTVRLPLSTRDLPSIKKLLNINYYMKRIAKQ